LERDEYEYPRNLSQPDAHPEEMVSDAVAIMMHRHKFDPKEPTVVGFASPTGLQRWFRPPPIAAEKLTEVCLHGLHQYGFDRR